MDKRLEIEIGSIVESIKGHDKGKIFLVVGKENGRVLIIDGKNKTFNNPKKKNEKHLLLRGEAERLAQEIINGRLIAKGKLKSEITTKNKQEG